VSKVINDGLTWCGTGCFIAVPMVTVGVKRLTGVDPPLHTEARLLAAQVTIVYSYCQLLHFDKSRLGPEQSPSLRIRALTHNVRWRSLLSAKSAITVTCCTCC